ncbi:MAG: hypothetical protein ACK5V3_02135 [Bdellovibrionales bacterium]
MKSILFTLTAFFASSLAHAQPLNLQGSWMQSGQVEIISIKDFRRVASSQEAQNLKNNGYTCRQVSNRILCEKSLPIPNQIQQNVLNSLRALAPSNVQIQPSQSVFELVHESPAYNEWSKRQNILVDGVLFTKAQWREVMNSPARFIVSRDQDSERLEFLVSKTNQLQKFVSASRGHDLNWQRLTVLINYRSLR